MTEEEKRRVYEANKIAYARIKKDGHIGLLKEPFESMSLNEIEIMTQDQYYNLIDEYKRKKEYEEAEKYGNICPICNLIYDYIIQPCTCCEPNAIGVRVCKNEHKWYRNKDGETVIGEPKEYIERRERNKKHLDEEMSRLFSNVKKSIND